MRPDHSTRGELTMKKLLLTSVIGPFGVDDAYGRKDNPMELMHNQVTREQGLFSMRFNHASFGLYLLAENVGLPTTVLDFPTLERFREELAEGYDFVGISFIIPNFKKARRMAEIVRQISPRTEIILGGHGTAVPDLEALIEHDHICRGEGVRFLRELFGEDPDRPIRHPVMHSSYNRKVMGVPVPDGSGILIPGVGCPNHCRFCATSHFFGRYVTFLPTGQDLFDACCAAEDELGVNDFGVLDENFLKLPDRARELVELMERHDRYFKFGIFSSAETLAELGELDLLVRLGVSFIWLGVESRTEIYDKNRGVDFGALVYQLRRRGIVVMASAILFLEHHDPLSIHEDIDFAIGLDPDFLQFMQLGPIPGTALYEDYEQQGKLLRGVPWEEQHGQDRIWFSHPAFGREQTRQVLRQAFRTDYERNGPSLLRNIDTNLRGYRYARDHEDARVRSRAAWFEAFARQLRPFVRASATFAANERTVVQARKLRREYREAFGRPTIKERLTEAAVLGFAGVESLRLRTVGDVRQPPTAGKAYRPARMEKPGESGLVAMPDLSAVSPR